MRIRSDRSSAEVYRQAVDALRAAGPAVKAALAEDRVGVVVVLDIDAMGDVNDRHGVDTGDRLLQAILASLRHRLAGAGRVARLAGDQFVVVAPGTLHGRWVLDTAVSAVARAKVRGRWGLPVRVSAHGGAATWHDDASRNVIIAAATAAIRGPLAGAGADRPEGLPQPVAGHGDRRRRPRI